MNLFGNQNKKFEKKLKQQFDGLEYKPSESLWDKISAEIPEDNFENTFENTFAENVNTFESKPNPELWNKIETQLPKSQDRNYRFLWIPLLFVFFGSAAYFGYQFKNKQLAIDNKLSVENKQKDNEQLANSIEKLEIGNEKKSNLIIPSNDKISIPKNHTIQTIKVDSKKLDGSNSIAENKKVVAQKSEKSISKPISSSGENFDKNRITKNESSSDLSVNPVVSERKAIAIQSEQKQNPITNTSTSQTKNEVSTPNLIPKVDSTIISNIPPVADANKNVMDSLSNKKSVQNSSNDEKLTKFSISVISGVQNCYNHLSAPSNSSINFSENLALRKIIETPMMDWNGAFLLDYAINSNWRFSTGVMVSNFSQQFQYAIQTPIGNHASIKDPSAKMNNQNDSIVNGNSYSNRIKYTWTEIPLFITYTFSHKQKIGIEITSGVSYAIISGVDASYVSNDNIGVLMLTDKNGFPGVKNNFFFHFYPTVTYKLNELVQIGIAPTFKYSITSITDNSNWIQQQPYFLGLSAMLRKKF